MAILVCDISGTVCRGDGAPISGVLVKATITSTLDDGGGQFIGSNGVSSTPIEAYSDDLGNFSITLLQGGTFLIEIPIINLRKNIIVPMEAVAELSTLS